MVDPDKKKDNKELWKVPDNPPPLKSRRKIKRRLTNPSIRASLTSVTSATSLTGEKSQSADSLRAMSDEVLVRGTHSASSLPATTHSMVTMIGRSASNPKIDSSELPLNPVPVEDEPEIKISRSSISLKNVRTPSKTSLVSARSSEIKRPSELKLETADTSKDDREPMRTSSHQSMSDIQIIEKANNVVEKHPNETRTDPKTRKSSEKPYKPGFLLWNSGNKRESRRSSAKPTSKQLTKMPSTQSAPQKVDVKTSIIAEYSNIIETIKQQNNNLEKIKRDMLSITVPSIRKSLEKRYFAEEDKLNDELVKAMVLQSRCPYERWPEIPVVPNIYDDYNGVHPHLLVKKARQHISSIEQPERKCAGEECRDGGEITSSDESNPCPSDPDTLFKDLLDKLDKQNPSEISCGKPCDPLNTVVTHLLKKRKNHINNCTQCRISHKNCRALESIDEELCRVCKLKLKQLKEEETRDNAKCVCDDAKSSQGPSEHSRPTSSSDDNQSCVSKQDLDSLEEEQISAIIKLTQLGKPEKPKTPSPCCKIRNEATEICSKTKVKPVSSCEANKLLSVLEKMTSELKQITQAQNSICNVADVCTIKNSEPPSSNANTMSHSNASANISSETTANSRTHSETEMVIENHKLKEQLRELKAEKGELKFIMREQESQMKDYRNRYLEAKQEIEEQLHHICELEKCNECIEDRINTEMKQIQCKFELNLKHLQTCLETESRKLKQVCKEKEGLKEKLNMCCSELHKEKCRRTGAGDQNRSDNLKLTDELQAVKDMYKQLEKVNTQQKEEIKCLKLELATLRRDTAAIISRSKDRVQRRIDDCNKRIYELEDELAKERAHSCCAIKERDRCNKLLECSRCEAQTAKAELRTLEAYVKTLCCQLEQLKCKPC